ncbi:hypothetical protein [Geoalkalibacter halelectricus]|uniref:Uncharacterized protein n=1 Tax=Geoalkalibacter halelectricus TaxID=2847045 RepID=A0ABY5ZSD1_9BACT|nr:hypothetical protein [Geoalkalibacter halelectricus]MDO3377964.1 hypothetical protein [Geoalkalibacter halelectricus]UWZ81533.1 hypothetical protein L9S41_09075 [Geoalkalibacter halelectricus]
MLEELERFVLCTTPAELRKKHLSGLVTHHLQRYRIAKFQQIVAEFNNNEKHKPLLTLEGMLPEKKNKIGHIGSISENYFYGHGLALREYCGSRRSITSCIEHAVYLDNNLPQRDCRWPVLCFSPRRESFLRTRGFEATAIGLPIVYTKGLLPAGQIERLKTRLGKTLIFFPFHSIENAYCRYSITEAIRALSEYQKEYKTIIVCIYFHDIKSESLIKRYKDAGFYCVTAGHREDPLFLKRLRSFFDISDATATNMVGTSSAYSLGLNIKHYIIDQDVKKIPINLNEPVINKKNQIREKAMEILKEQKNINNENDFFSYNFGTNIKLSCKAIKELLHI